MKINYYNRQNKGITLIALVITIIILLILAGITILSLTNTGLFGKAQEAKEKTQVAERNQTETLNEYEDELNKYNSGASSSQPTTPTTPTPTPQVGKLADKVKVGDYVTYTPDALDSNALSTLKSNLNTYSGNSSSTVNSVIDRQDLKWRVLDVQNGQVRLISEKPTTSRIELKGYNGYNNAVKLIDDACSTLYTNKKLASKVQNLKIENITDYMKTKPTEGTKYPIANIKYPKILENEENQTVVNSTTNNKLGVSSQDGFITGNNTSASSSLKNTWWNKSMNNTDSFINSKYYELFIKNGNIHYDEYWVSSRCVYADSDRASFCVRVVWAGNVGVTTMCNAGGGEEAGRQGLPPMYNSKF